MRILFIHVLLIYYIIVHNNNVYAICHGRPITPVSDVCWECILPISIGPLKTGKGSSPSKRDTKNPSNPICACRKDGVPILGISLGFWEPVRLIDVTRVPYCMTLLGGLQLGSPSAHKIGGNDKSYESGRVNSSSFYYVHYYIYPILYLLELVTDLLVCQESANFDVAYLSELDPVWNDSKLQNLLHPEAFLFGNIAAQAVCSTDCVSSSFAMPQDELFWCIGCWGNIYPFSGLNAHHIGGVQSSSLYAARILAKMHRFGLAQRTSTSKNTNLLKGRGELCQPNTLLRIKKSQYKLQMLYPSPKTAAKCWPLGCSAMFYNEFKEYPMDGEDWGYLVWRKRNCCVL